jgi:hypothetical protein
MTNQIDEQPVACHLFENTVQMSIAPDLTFRGLEKGIMPCQIMCVHKLQQAWYSTDPFSISPPASLSRRKSRSKTRWQKTRLERP